ncbi:MAG: ethylbenzene dehydrogenase-related protein, partial [Desulfobulbaceae bacterium]|nr:ethylbenzene dehydrogenase-related protein [Desulfobulbaceae bacterium]
IAQVEISIKSVYSNTTIYFLVSYLDKDESRLHRCWIWDKEKEMYIEGPTREDIFVFKWKLDEDTKDLSIYSDESYAADIWYWKAYRTDPEGFADDKIQRLFSYPTKDSYEITSKSGNKMYIQRQGDTGRSSYKSKIFIDYQGDMIHRYEVRQPQSSRADVRAKGVWKDGRWTIEFARALVTDNLDDINFHSLDRSYGFGVSRYEIAGRPQENSDQPFFGSGDITELLTLEFEK